MARRFPSTCSSPTWPFLESGREPILCDLKNSLPNLGAKYCSSPRQLPANWRVDLPENIVANAQFAPGEASTRPPCPVPTDRPYPVELQSAQNDA